MTTCFLAPGPVQDTFFIPGGNTPGNGVQVGFFVSGSSTPQTVYKDPAANVAWPNPIILDSGGNLPLGGEVWFPAGQTFTVKWAPANDVFPPTSPYRTMDNLSGINDVSSSGISDWISGPTPTFVSGTSFTVAGDQTLLFTNGRRVKSTNTGGTIYSTITSVGFLAGVTTVRVANDVGVLDAGISAVSYGLIDPAASSIDFYHVGKDGGTIVSASTTDIWGIKGTQVNITSTNTIFSFSTSAYAGATRIITSLGNFVLNTSSVLTLPVSTGVVTTQVGDRFEVMASTNAAAQITWYQRADGTPLNYNLTSSNVPPSIGGSLLLIQTTTVVNASTVQFRNIPPFDNMLLKILNAVPATDGSTIGLQLSTNNAVNFVSSGTYASSVFGKTFNGSTLAFGINTGSSYTLAGFPGQFGMSNVSQAGGASVSVELIRFNTTSQAKTIYGNGGVTLSAVGQVLTTLQVAGVTSDGTLLSSVINAINILPSAGNFSSGTFSLYAVRNS